MNHEMFHVTPRRNRERILERGLWRGAAGYDAGFIWMFSDQAIALEAALTGTWGGTGDNMVFVIDTCGLDVFPDPHPGWGTYWDRFAYATSQDVSPDRLRELLPL